MSLLAIVVPYYRKDHFDVTFRSLINQTNQSFTLYLGDDYSDDNPLSIINKYKYNFTLIYKRFKNNLGRNSLTLQWERCIDMIKGGESWVMILGDDDVLQENVIEEFYNNLYDIRQSKNKVIRFATQKINGLGVVLSNIFLHPKIENSLNFLFRLECHETRSSLSEYVFCLEVLKKKGFVKFPLGWYSDWIAVIEVSNLSDVYTINSAHLNIRIHDKSISGSVGLENEKTKAMIMYYLYLIDYYYPKLDKIHFAHFNGRLEKLMSENKKNILLWVKLIRVYSKWKLFKFLSELIKVSINTLFKQSF